MHTANRMKAIVFALLLSATSTCPVAIARHPHGGWSGGQFAFGGHHAHGLYASNLWGPGPGWSPYPGWGYSRSVSLGYRSFAYGSLGYGGLAYNGLSYSRRSYPGLWLSGGYVFPQHFSSLVGRYYVPRVTYLVPAASYYYGPDACSYQRAPINCVQPLYVDQLCPLAGLNDSVTSCVASATCEDNLPLADYSEANLSTDSSSNLVPAQLLSAADAIFQAGGYRQAASAYAQLHVRFGSSDQIFGRRFVAQVACGDYDQAAVVLMSAQAAGFPIERIAMESKEFSPLFSGQAELLSAWTESLARYALESNDPRESLSMMATWLNLSGQTQRAGLFLAMVDRLSREATPPTSDIPPNLLSAEELPPPPGSKSALVSRTE